VTTKGAWSIAKGGADGAMTIVRLDGGGKAEFAQSFERLSEPVHLLSPAPERAERLRFSSKPSLKRMGVRVHESGKEGLAPESLDVFRETRPHPTDGSVVEKLDLDAALEPAATPGQVSFEDFHEPPALA